MIITEKNTNSYILKITLNYLFFLFQKRNVSVSKIIPLLFGLKNNLCNKDSWILKVSQCQDVDESHVKYPISYRMSYNEATVQHLQCSYGDSAASYV